MRFMIQWTGRPVTYRPVGIWVQQGRETTIGLLSTGEARTVLRLVPEDHLEEHARLANPYLEAFGPIFETTNYKSPDELVLAGLRFIRAEWSEAANEFRKPIADLA